MEPRARIEAELLLHHPQWRLRWLEPDELRARSRGRITHAHGLNPRTHKPERGGLLCCKIFGPVDDLRCLCTKYAGELHRGITCEKCGVDVVDLAARRERFGHIELPAAIPHPWSSDRALECLLVLPAGFREQPVTERRPDLRGLNGLYQRVLQHADQLRRCTEHYAPTIILEHETTQLGRAVARLFGQPRHRPGPGPTLADHLQRALLDLDPHVALPWPVTATLAALGLAVEQ